MRLVTWNIQWGRGVDGRVDLGRIAARIRELADFDVICLQEVADNFAGLEGYDGRDQFAELARLLPEWRVAESISIDEPGDDGRRRRFGNALFTRYPMLRIRRHALPWPEEPDHDTMPRSAVEATLQSPMGPLRVTTTHLEYYSDLQRRAQVRRLCALQDEACHRDVSRSIVVGDFNFPPDDAAYSALQAPLSLGAQPYRDAWRVLHGHRPHTPTFCVYAHEYSKTPYCCDFAFVSEDLGQRVKGLRVDGDTRASDHQPLVLELDDR